MANWPTPDDIESFVRSTHERAAATARNLGLKVVKASLSVRDKLSEGRMDASTIAASPEYDRLRINEALLAHMSCLFVDMVGSTKRKQRVPTANDFIVNQTYLNTVSWLALSEAACGRLAGYRGDGAFFVWPYKTSFSPDWVERKIAVRRSVATAVRMQKAVSGQINPVLVDNGIEPIHVSIGIHTGHVLIARCGASEEASELTIIGKAADLASKFADSAMSGEILIEDRLDALFETTDKGVLRFVPKKAGEHNALLVRSNS